MIDTIRIRSPKIAIEHRAGIREKLMLKMAIKDQMLLYEFTADNLQGSFDANVSVKLVDYIFEFDVKSEKPVKIPSTEYFWMEFEFSLNKYFYGHNVYGGERNDISVLALFLQDMSMLLDYQLPDYKVWELLRIDISQNYYYKPYIISQFFKSYQGVRYPRRKTRFFDDGLYFTGTTTTFKIYYKGTEFKKHDRKRLKKHLPFHEVDKLQEIADRILRVEVEIHIKKLKDLFNNNTIINNLDIDKMINLFDMEVEKVMKLKGTGKRMSKNEEVSNHLVTKYGALGRSVYSTWVMLTTMAELDVKARMSDATYYRHKKIMKEENISYINTDLSIIDVNIIPVDFSLNFNSKYAFKLKKYVA